MENVKPGIPCIMREESQNDNEAQEGFLRQRHSGLIIVFIQKELGA